MNHKLDIPLNFVYILSVDVFHYRGGKGLQLSSGNKLIFFWHKHKGVDNGGARGAEAPPDFSP